MFLNDVVLLAGARTPMARYTGAFKELRRRGKRYGLATAWIGGGRGIAMIVESVS